MFIQNSKVADIYSRSYIAACTIWLWHAFVGLNVKQLTAHGAVLFPIINDFDRLANFHRMFELGMWPYTGTTAAVASSQLRR